jgi:hypothetical protein
LNDEEEIIAGFPLKTYYSGILFPERTGINKEVLPDLLIMKTIVKGSR